MKRVGCVTVVAVLLAAGCGDAESGVTSVEGLVCGADGKTYSVEEAAKGQHEVSHRGRCDEPMHCETPTDCFVGDACERPAADAPALPDGAPTHWCVPGPTHCNCPGVFEPVCGGDGRNYVNACEAACAGVGIRHEGLCGDPPTIGCVRAGCSDQLCVEEGVPIASTCEWRDVYVCYQEATCERQENGQCGFTPTHELVECLERHGEGLCRIDPRWQNGFTAECESDQAPGVVGIVAVKPGAMMRLGEPFVASFELLEPPLFGDQVRGEGELFCDGEQTLMRGVAPMTPLGELTFICRILPEIEPGECFDDEDCPPGHYCQPLWTPEGEADESNPERQAGVCMDLCAVIDCRPGYECEEGQCVPRVCVCPDVYAPVCGVDGNTYGNACEAECAQVEVAYEGECASCPPSTHVRAPDGRCERKCYGPEQCRLGEQCNATEVCLQDPACPACDVCVGWCEPSSDDCRVTGCEEGHTCDYCPTPEGDAAWICLPPNAGACPPPPDDCRPTGCNGEICADRDLASPCVALPEFACYQEHGICERQPWGQCDWTRTPELDMCLAEFDCRSQGCGEGLYCTFCWTDYACIPEGAVC